LADSIKEQTSVAAKGFFNRGSSQMVPAESAKIRGLFFFNYGIRANAVMHSYSRLKPAEKGNLCKFLFLSAGLAKNPSISF
jgi:hypothetical protein